MEKATDDCDERDFHRIMFGESNALYFEPFLAWIYKLMLAYPQQEENNHLLKSISSRSLPRYYTKKVH